MQLLPGSVFGKGVNAVALQTGLRSNELRSLSRRNLFLDAAERYLLCRADNTKNLKPARQYVSGESANRLRQHVAKNTPGAGVFDMPHETKLAQMLRDDLAEARRRWLDEVKHSAAERLERDQSDFLVANNDAGEVLDFHALRHTFGAWLAMTGAHPKVIQSAMRHSTITLSMDTYGHLFPGQDFEAVGRLNCLMAPSSEVLAATGTEDTTAGARSAGRSSQDANRCANDATPCEESAVPATVKFVKNSIKIAARCDSVPSATMLCDTFAPLAQLAEQLTLNQ